MEHSVFARLSPELRNRIFSHTFSSDFAVTLHDGNTQHALTKTCRQIRVESLSMYHAMTRFNAHLEDAPVTPVVHWLQSIGQEASLLVREINLWDMRHLLLTIYSPQAMKFILTEVSPDGDRYALSDDCGRLGQFGGGNPFSAIYLSELRVALHKMDIDLKQVCERQEDGTLGRCSQYAMSDVSRE